MKAREALGRNVRAALAIRDMKQNELARAMKALGHGWEFRTVSRVVNGDRGVDVDELFSLALALGRNIPELLQPEEDLDVGARMPPDATDLLLRGRARIQARWEWESDDSPKGAPIFDIQKVAGSPEEQMELLREMLGDVKP